MDGHDGAECGGCEWERHPQAFRWFPELGAPLSPASTAGSVEGLDDQRPAGAA